MDSNAPLRLEIQHVDGPNGPISYAVLGRGSPLLFLSPYSVPLIAQWRLQMGRDFLQRLGKQHRVLLIDDPYYVGPGEHDLPVPDNFLSRQIDDLVAVLNAANFERCHVLATFLTAITAAALAGRHPVRVESLMLWDGLLNGASLPQQGEVHDLMSMTRSRDLGVATRSWIGVAGIAGGAEVAREQRDLMAAVRDQPPGDRVTIRGLSESDATADASQIRCPTIVVSPEGAIVPGSAVVEAMALAIPGARLVRTEGTAISPHLDDPSIAMPLVLDWLSEAAAGTTEAMPAHDPGLTPRELEVLRLVGQGLTNRAIAEHLTLSVHTIGRHVSNLMSKLDANNRTEAVQRARGHGILD